MIQCIQIITGKRRKHHEKARSYRCPGSLPYSRLVLSACGGGGIKASDQSKSPLIGTWIAREKDRSDITFNADGTGYLQRGNITEKITFADNGDGTYKMSTEHAQKPITEGYRIEGDTLYKIDMELGIEEAYTRKQ